jgi:thiamine transport system permease protein
MTNRWAWPEAGELRWALTNSFFQAFFSALLTLFLGFWISLSLLQIPRSRLFLTSLFHGLCLIPQFIPLIVSLVGLFNFVQPFPQGVVGIVAVQTFLNCGFAGLLLFHSLQTVWSETSDVARSLGATRFLFWRQIGIPQLKKEISLLFVYFFSSYFTAFSIPLILGGGQGTTLEILIYEKMRISSDWSPAIFLSWIQIGFIFLLSWMASGQRKKGPKREADLSWLGSPWGLGILILQSGLFLGGFGKGLFEGWRQKSDLLRFSAELGTGFLSSLALGLITFVLLTGLMKALVLLGRLPSWLDRFLRGYLAPSTSLTCFAFLILFPADAAWSFLKIPLAFTILSFPSLYRMGFGERLQELQGQIENAEILGASSYLTLTEVTWPQIKSRSRFYGALVATWACGDFAVARILSTDDFSLGLIAQTLLSSYRMSLASVVSGLLLLCCLTCYFLIMGWDYVDRRKS